MARTSKLLGEIQKNNELWKLRAPYPIKTLTLPDGAAAKQTATLFIHSTF